jgi:hypothetical protein
MSVKVTRSVDGGITCRDIVAPFVTETAPMVAW